MPGIMPVPEPDYPALRRLMVNEQLRQRGIRDAAVLRAMSTVPREQFVLPEYHRLAYDDGPLPIPAGQTISQPYVVAVMIEALELSPTDHVLEIGAGSGYAAAVISRIVRRVTTIERHGELAQFAREKLRNLGYSNVTVYEGDGSRGWPADAPYAAIIVAASGPAVPVSLCEQLAVGGRLVMPIGGRKRDQKLVRAVRMADGRFPQEIIGQVRFVPLIGAEGWGEG
jgi:protein-L-isoaspartate(D-aspartate) O-methyltransferase